MFPQALGTWLWQRQAAGKGETLPLVTSPAACQEAAGTRYWGWGSATGLPPSAAHSLSPVRDARGMPDLLVIWWCRSQGFAPSFPSSGSAVLGERDEAGPLSFRLR